MIQLRQLWKNDREGTHLVDGQVLPPLLSVDQAFLWHHRCTESLMHQSEKQLLVFSHGVIPDLLQL